jgi:hypothetical protein
MSSRRAPRTVACVHALVVTYRLRGATAPEHAELREELAPALAAVSGLRSLTWLENDATGSYGGFYLFEDRPAFDAFVASELFGLLHSQPGVTEVTTSDYAVRTSIERSSR